MRGLALQIQWAHQKTNNFQKQSVDCGWLIMNAQLSEECMVIGYFGIRAKAQVCRLLCEYLNLAYRDQFFTPQQWEDYEKKQAKDWIIKGLPFLKHGDFVVTGQHGMIEYIIRRAGALTLLGTTLKDRLKIDHFKSKYDIKDNIIALICHINRSNPKGKPEHAPEYYWENKLLPKLMEFEEKCKEEDWYFGYLTVADFSFYEMMNNLKWLFPEIANTFPKLNALKRKVLRLKQIEAYQSSQRTVKIFNPVFFFNQCENNKQLRRMEIQAK